MEQKDQLMKSLPVWQLIPRLTIPTVIITLVMVIYNMADIFFIGQTGNSQMGMQPAMSYNFGRGDLQRVREIIRKTAIVTLILGTVISVICILFRSPILHAFIDNDEVYRYAGILLIGCMCSSPIYGIFQLCAALLQATNKPSWGTVVTIVRHGIVFIPAMLLLNHIFGYQGLAFAIPVTDICAAVLGITLSNIWLQQGVRLFENSR